MSLLPVRPGRLEDSSFLLELKRHIALELLELVTHPGSGYGDEATSIFDRFEKEGKLPFRDKLVNGMFCRCCQEIRLTPTEISELQSAWFS